MEYLGPHTAGSARVARMVDVGGGSITVGTVTPSASENDLDLSAYTMVRSNHAQPTVWTGIAAGSDGESKVIVNVTTEFPLIICDEAVTSSTAANRVKADPSGLVRGHMLLLPGDGVELQYDGTSSRWRANTLLPGAWRRGLRPTMILSVDPSNTFGRIGPNTLTTGTLAGAAASSGSYSSERIRVTLTTGTVAGTSAGVCTASKFLIRGGAAGRGGFLTRLQFGGTTVPTTDAAVFLGLIGSTSALGNVNVSTLTDVFGVGLDPTQSTLRRVNNDGSGSAVMTDLGSDYPWNTTANHDVHFLCAPGGSGMSGVIWRQDDLSIVPKAWYESSDIPAGGTALAWQQNVNNRAASTSYVLTHFGAEMYTP